MFAATLELDVGWLISVLVGAGGVIAFLFRMIVTDKNKQIDALTARNTQLENTKQSYEDMAIEGVKSARATANYYLQKEGKPPIIPLVPVISESHSPSTEEQREAARIATLRAEMAQVKVVMGQPPREEPPKQVASSDKAKPVASQENVVVGTDQQKEVQRQQGKVQDQQAEVQRQQAETQRQQGEIQKDAKEGG